MSRHICHVTLLMHTFTGAVHAQEQQLDAELRKYRGQAFFAQSTAATYKSQLRTYFRFCLYFGYRPVPFSSHNLLRYVLFLAQTLAASSIACYLNVVRILHLQRGFPNPLQDTLFKFQKELLMRGTKRLRCSSKAPYHTRHFT